MPGRQHGPASGADTSPHFLLDRLSGRADAGERRAREVGSAAGRTARDTGSKLAGGAGPSIVERTPSVRDLPVGGLAPLLSRATAVARETATEVAEQAAALPARAERALAAAGGAGSRLLASTADPMTTVDEVVQNAQASAGAWRPSTAVTPNSARSEAGGASEGPSGGDSAGLSGRADELLEVLEDRLIAELERRGGRFAGVF